MFGKTKSGMNAGILHLITHPPLFFLILYPISFSSHIHDVCFSSNDAKKRSFSIRKNLFKNETSSHHVDLDIGHGVKMYFPFVFYCFTQMTFVYFDPFSRILIIIFQYPIYPMIIFINTHTHTPPFPPFIHSSIHPKITKN